VRPTSAARAVTVTPNTRTTGALARSGGIETIMRLRHFDWQTRSVAMMIDPGAKLLAVLDRAEEYRGLALRAKDRGERESTSASSSYMWRSLRSLKG
jgi:hypothetical protein